MTFLLICVATALINTFLGVFVFLRNPKGQANIFFGLLTISIVGWIVTLLLYYLISEHLPLLFIGRLNFAVSVPMTFFFYRLVSVFPKETIKQPKWIIRTAIIITVIATLLSLFTPFIDQDEIARGDERFVTYGSLYFTWLIVFFVNLVLGLVILAMKIKRSSGIIRVQLMYLLVGFLLFITIGGTMNVILPFFGNYSLQQVGPLTTILFVGFTTFAIVKHRLYDIRLLVARSVVYSMLLFLISLIFTVLVYWSGSLFFGTKTEPFELIASVILAMFIALAFQPLKEFLKTNTDRFLYKTQYKPNFLLSELNTTILHKTELGSLVSSILLEIIKVIHLTKGAIILFKNEQIDEVKLVDWAEKEFEIGMLQELAQHKRIIIAQEEENQTLKKIMEELGVGIAFPLYTGATTHGMVLLGEKKNGEIFTETDIQFFEIFVPNFAIAVENARSFEEIKNFNETLKAKVDEQTKDLRFADQHLKELDKLKDEFVAVVSHELRTPMTVVRGNLWMILDGDKDLRPDTRKRLDVSFNSVRYLISLINDILSVSAIEGNRFKLSPQKMSVAAVLSEVSDELQPLVQEKDINIINSLTKEKFEVNADPERIKQVFTNLIGNAIKFTHEKGTITISSHKDNGKVAISISDTGQGIKKEDLPKLFTKFGKLSDNKDQPSNKKGVGLGLYICKRIIEMSDGTIDIASTEGKGTTVTFTLPAA